MQACLLADKLADYRNGLSENPDVSVIFCGDFNSEPGQHAYNVVVNQKLTNEEAEKLGKIYYAIDPETKFSEEKVKGVKFSIIFAFTLSKTSVRGRRKHLKLGGKTLRGHFSLRKRGHFLKINRALLCLLQNLIGYVPQCPPIPMSMPQKLSKCIS